MDKTLGEIASLVGGSLVGDPTIRITGMNGIRDAGPGDLTFLADSRYDAYLSTSQAGGILVPLNVSEARRPIIQVSDVRMAMFALLKAEEESQSRRVPGIHPLAAVDEQARLGKDVSVGALASVGRGAQIGDGTQILPGAVIGRDVKIGSDSVIHSNATIYDGVIIGARCIIHGGACIGADGFGFFEVGKRQVKVPQVGTVEIGDDVEVGANSAIDRATLGATVIGSGSKIDNLVQIGHNVRLGRNCIVCGNAGIAGSAILGDNVVIGAGAGVAGHIELGAGASVAAYSGVTKSVKAGGVVFGFPAVEVGKNRRMQAALRQLPDTLRHIRALERRIEELEGKLHGTTENDR